MKTNRLLIASLLIIPLLGSCSGLQGENSQYTKKLDAAPFVAPLNSKVSKVIAIDVKPGEKIAWLGLNHSGDYKLFQVDDVTINGKKINAPVKGPDAVFSQMPAVGVQPGVSTDQTKVYLTVTYKAKRALTTTDSPHLAYLLIVFEGGKQGTVLVNLSGYVRGVCTDCKAPLDESFTYTVKDNDGNGEADFGFFICDSKALTGKVTTDNKKDIPDGFYEFPADSTSSSPFRFDLIELTGLVGKDTVPKDFTFYFSDKSLGNVLIDSGDGDVQPTIPPFEIPVPGGKPVSEVSVSILDGFQTACPIAADGTFTCSDDTDTGIELNVFDGILNVNNLTLTTASVVASSTDCPDFGTWTGAGKIDGIDDVTLIGFATVPQEQGGLVKEAKTDIEGATIVAVIKLTPAK